MPRTPAPAPPRRSSAPLLPVLLAALTAILTVQMVDRDPRFVVPLAVFGLALFVPVLVGRWRMRKLLISGDVERVIGTWEGSIDRVAHRDTMAPLLKATAYAAYGWIEAARRALERAVRGPAWDAALEQRLFVETLLDTFEGNRDRAVRKAEALESLPMPRGSLLARRRVALLRRGLAAMTRAFAHASREGDARLLGRAAAAPPRSSTGPCATPPPSSRSTAAVRARCRRCSRAPRRGPIRAHSTCTTTSCSPTREVESWGHWRAPDGFHSSPSTSSSSRSGTAAWRPCIELGTAASVARSP